MNNRWGIPNEKMREIWEDMDYPCSSTFSGAWDCRNPL